MKNLKIFISLGTLAAVGTGLFPSCNDLDQEYLGGYVTDDQKAEVLERNPEMAQAGIVGIMAAASTYMTVYDSHFDFGQPACLMMADFRGMDYPNPMVGFNWFQYSEAMSDCKPDGVPTNMFWSHYYKQIFACNAAAKSIAADTENAELQFYLAQALAIRAYDYFTLIQLYQFTYVGNESEPGVCLITNENEEEVAANGAPRATVQEVYDQILKDVNTAIDLLTKSGLTPDGMLADKPKRFFSLATAYGLRARINLVMNKWSEAASDAQTAIAKFNGSPYTIDQATPGKDGKYPFWSLNDANWMWGIPVAETDRVVTSGIVNFPSMMSLLVGNSYVEVGAWRLVNPQLYNSLPSTDVRRTWWLSDDGSGIGFSTNPTIQAYNSADGGPNAPAYMNVKFGPYQDKLGNDTKACDIPLMRIEEMYYISAEATAMAGGDGASILNSFVQAYRNPNFATTATGADLQEVVWNQRRAEFWGEGLSYLDIMRLKKGIDRRDCGYEPSVTYNIAYGDNVMRVPLPDSEITGNKALTSAMNNPTAVRPTPVGGEGGDEGEDEGE